MVLSYAHTHLCHQVCLKWRVCIPLGALEFFFRVQVRSRGGRRCWTLKRAQERTRAGRRSWAQKVGLPFASLAPQQLCYGHCACDCLAQQLKRQLASHWQGPYYCFHIAVVLVVVHSLLGPCGLEQVDEPLTLSLFPTFPLP